MNQQNSAFSPEGYAFANNYSELIGQFTMEMKNEGKSVQDIKNARSAAYSWLDALNYSASHPPGQELEVWFPEKLNEYKKVQFEAGFKKETTLPRVSRIKKFRLFYLKTKERTELPPNFSERLKYLLESRGYTRSSFWKLFLQDKVGRGNFNSWLEGSQPIRKPISLIEMIERYLECEAGTLTSTLFYLNRSFNIPPSDDECSRRLIENQKKKYRIWTPKMEADFIKLVKFKTATVLPEGLKRNRNAAWTRDVDGNVPSAVMFKDQLKSFFGFCCLPVDSEDPTLRGLGLDPEKLSLTLLLNKGYLEKYITEFRLARAGGKYNKAFEVFITSFASLMTKDFGYLYQKHELRSEMTEELTVAQWRRRCLAVRSRLNDIRNFIVGAKMTGSPDFGKGRDITGRIGDLIKAKSPMDETLKMVKDMIADAPKLHKTRSRRAQFMRDLLLIALLQANPLRIKMFGFMEFDRHLVQERDGSWWLQFEKNEFKTRKGNSGPYRARVSEYLWPMINEYRDVWRPMFYGAKHCKYVFIVSSRNKPKKAKYRMTRGALSAIVCKITYQYLERCIGFRAHSFRHILATDLIRKNPFFGVYLAAIALNDTPETIKENYKHLLISESFEPYNIVYGDAFRRVVLGEPESEDRTFSFLHYRTL